MATPAPIPVPMASERSDDAQALGPKIIDIRQRRRPTEDKWLLAHAAWRGAHTRSFFVSETFKHYLPAARRAIERHTTRVTQQLMPSNEFFEVYPGDDADVLQGRQAQGARAYFYHLLTKRIKVYGLTKRAVRCFNLYGRAITKTGICIEGTDIWPTWRPVDPFMFFVWPETASRIDDAQMVFEDVLMPWETYQEFVRDGRARDIPPDELGEPTWPLHITQRLQYGGISTPSSTQGETPSKPPGVKAAVRFVALTEVYFKMNGAWSMRWFVWNAQPSPLQVREMDGLARPPYRMAVARELPGEQYTTSMMDDLEPFQVMANDQVNLMLEGQAMSFGPPVVVDPGLNPNHAQWTYAPRKKWLGTPEAVDVLKIPDTTRAGLQAVQTTLGLIDGFAGSSPLAEGTPTRNMPRAGFAVSSLLQLALSDMRDVAQLVEDEILTPSLADMHELVKRFVPPEQVMKIPGTADYAAMKVDGAELAKDYAFKWVGALQAQDYQVRAQRMIAFVNVLMKGLAPIQQTLQAAGMQLNLAEVLTRLWREAMGERGAETIIKRMTPDEMVAQLLAAAPPPGSEYGGMPGGMGPGGGPQAPANLQEMGRQDGRVMSETGIGGNGLLG